MTVILYHKFIIFCNAKVIKKGDIWKFICKNFVDLQIMIIFAIVNKRVIILAFLFCTFINLFPQVNVTHTSGISVAELVEKFLIGPNVTLVVDDMHRATFNNKDTVYSNQLGIFSNFDTTSCNMPMDEGLVIVTGNYKSAGNDAKYFSPNAVPSSSLSDFEDSAFFFTYSKYCIDNNLPIMEMHDIGSLSFWIKCNIKNFSFSYCFASNEYNKYEGSLYNDFFGFYFSGPYDENGNFLAGSTAYVMQNIALIPGTQIPVMINTVNHGGDYDPEPKHPEYHKLKTTTECKQNCLMEAYTVKLPTALVNVIDNAYYKIEIDIANINDHKLNSAIYLSKDMRRFDTIYIDTSICDNEEYYFECLDSVLTREGTYTCIKQNETMGDSITILNLGINPTSYHSFCWTLSDGDVIDMNGKEISTEGVFVSTLQTEFGCDSIIIYDVRYGEVTQEIDCFVSNEDINYMQNIITISPNPADNQITLEGLTQTSNVYIFDCLGNKLICKEVSPANPTINISSFKSGLYYIQILSKQHIYGTKFVVR